MRPELISIFVLSLFLWPTDTQLLQGQQGQAGPAASLAKLKNLLTNYQDNLKSTLSMVRDDKKGPAGAQLNKAKEALKQVTTLITTDSALANIPGIKELAAPLTRLTDLTNKLNLNLDSLLDSVTNVFSVLGQVTNKMQQSVEGAKATVSGGMAGMSGR